MNRTGWPGRLVVWCASPLFGRGCWSRRLPQRILAFSLIAAIVLPVSAASAAFSSDGWSGYVRAKTTETWNYSNIAGTTTLSWTEVIVMNLRGAAPQAALGSEDYLETFVPPPLVFCATPTLTKQWTATASLDEDMVPGSLPTLDQGVAGTYELYHDEDRGVRRAEFGRGTQRPPPLRASIRPVGRSVHLRQSHDWPASGLLWSPAPKLAQPTCSPRSFAGELARE
jgi:hypothetical protein